MNLILSKNKLAGLIGVTAVLTGCVKEEIPEELPNILWITSEDNSPYFIGCYGNPFATTPNIDQLAADGFKYTHAYANCPVCSPARNTIITGVYAASNGNEQMRSTYPKSVDVGNYAEILHDAGYYTTNNSKTDYNYDGDYNAIWDESSRDAHYYNRAEGQPFFAIYNLMTTHESRIHNQIPTEDLKHSPEDVVPYIAPYHPVTEEMKHDWAQYYDLNQQMDEEVGALLQELEDRGLADNTIVFYYGDHGGVLARSKRYIYNTGTQVPFVIRIPEKYKYLFPEKNPGDEVDRIISFVDLAPTLLSIAGIPIPDYMQGDAFLGQQKTKDPEYAIMTRQRMDERYDMVRAVTDGKYRYIRNYMPFRISLQHLDYLFNAPSAQSWEDAFYAQETNRVQSRAFWEKPVEEFYDTENDPWEINNLIDDPGYARIIDQMREAEEQWMQDVRDVGLIPETEYSEYMGDGSMYDYMRSEECPFDELLAAAQLATSPGDGEIGAYIENLGSSNSAIRYWGAVGLLIHRENAQPAMPALEEACNDESGAVATIAAETLYRLGEEQLAWDTYTRIMKDSETYGMEDRNFALNSVDAVNSQSPEIIEAVKTFYETPAGEGFGRYSAYDMTMSEYLLNKWGVEVERAESGF